MQRLDGSSEHAAESLTTRDAAVHGYAAAGGDDELVSEALMVPLGVIMRREFFYDLAPVVLAQRYGAAQTLAPD
jgi:hypothetical protein